MRLTHRSQGRILRTGGHSKRIGVCPGPTSRLSLQEVLVLFWPANITFKIFVKRKRIYFSSTTKAGLASRSVMGNTIDLTWKEKGDLEGWRSRNGTRKCVLILLGETAHVTSGIVVYQKLLNSRRNLRILTIERSATLKVFWWGYCLCLVVVTLNCRFFTSLFANVTVLSIL